MKSHKYKAKRTFWCEACGFIFPHEKGLTRCKNCRTENKLILFHSLKEANRWVELRFLEGKEIIHKLKRQIKYVLIPSIYHQACKGEPSFWIYSVPKKNRKKYGITCVQKAITYTADFTYERWKIIKESEKGKIILPQEIVEDVKGYKTEAYKKKKKLMKQIWDIEIEEV